MVVLPAQILLRLICSICCIIMFWGTLSSNIFRKPQPITTTHSARGFIFALNACFHPPACCYFRLKSRLLLYEKWNSKMSKQIKFCFQHNDDHAHLPPDHMNVDLVTRLKRRSLHDSRCILSSHIPTASIGRMVGRFDIKSATTSGPFSVVVAWSVEIGAVGKEGLACVDINWKIMNIRPPPKIIILVLVVH